MKYFNRQQPCPYTYPSQNKYRKYSPRITFVPQNPFCNIPGGSLNPAWSASSSKIFSLVAAPPIARGKNEVTMSLINFTKILF